MSSEKMWSRDGIVNIALLKAQAQQELDDEARRSAVDAMKEKMRNKKPLWDRLFPWKITITRKGE